MIDALALVGAVVIFAGGFVVGRGRKPQPASKRTVVQSARARWHIDLPD